MKKILAAILCAVMIIVVFPLHDLWNVNGFAITSYAATTGPTITSEGQQVNAGETISIPINITNNTGIMGFSISLKYDSALLTPVSVSGGELFSSGAFQDSIGYSEAGIVKIVWTGTEDVTANGTLFTIDFEVSKNAIGDTDIDVSYSQGDTFNEDYEDVVFNCLPIGLTITNTSSLITVGNSAVSAGESVDVPVDIVRSKGLGVVVLTVTYDSEKLTPTSVNNGLTTVLSDNIGTTAGSITIVVNSVSDSVGDGTLFSISFIAKENCSGTTSVGVSSSDGTSCQSGTITILEKEKTNTASLSADNVTANSSQTIRIPIAISDNPGLMGFKINVKYDSKVLTPISVEKGGVISSGSFDHNCGSENGTFDVIWNSSENMTDNGELIYLEFYVSDVVKITETTIQISYSQQDTFNEDWEDIVLICPDIKVTINPTRIIDNYVFGLAELTKSNSDVINSLFDLSSGQYLTNFVETQGDYMGTGSTVDYYDSEGSLIGTYTFIVYGDVNGDSVADVLDAAFVALVVNGYKTATIEQIYAANAGNSEIMDVTSYQNVINIILGNGDISCGEASKDGEEILGTLDDISCDIYIAADSQISSNNPILVAKIDSTPITWTVNNTKNYDLIGDSDTGYILAVKNYEGIENEQLTLTATIKVYDGLAQASRDFKINTNIFRAGAENTEVTSFGLLETLERESEFSYKVNYNEVEDDDFSQKVKPVVDSIQNILSAVDKNGNEIDIDDVVSEVRTNGYKIKESAPIGAVLTILTQIGHYSADSEFICDYSFSKEIEIVARTFNVNLVLNGGTAEFNNMQVTGSYEVLEDSAIFELLSVEKYGYSFDGWYTDASFTNELAHIYMPSDDITIYAKWVPNTHKLYFDTNGGVCEEDSIEIIFDSKYGALPVPEREYYEFQGWYTSTDWVEEITSETVLLSDEDITVYAKWSPKKYSLLFNANEGVTTTSSKEITCFEAIGELPVPTRDYYTFKGWFTELEGGIQITETDVINSVEDITVYAQWEENPVSDWVLESEVPAEVEILATRYMYDTTTRETKTSLESSLPEWTLYDQTTETVYKDVTYYHYVVYGLYSYGDYTHYFAPTEAEIIDIYYDNYSEDAYSSCYKITYTTTTQIGSGIKGNYSGCKAERLDGKDTRTINITGTILYPNGTSVEQEVDYTETTYYYERYVTEKDVTSTAYPSTSSDNVTISNVKKQVKYRCK